jgi:hypothetical protein
MLYTAHVHSRCYICTLQLPTWSDPDLHYICKLQASSGFFCSNKLRSTFNTYSLVQMESPEQSASLLQLPVQCLLHILSSEALRADNSSICNAARAHSRLYKAAVAAQCQVQNTKYSRRGLESVLLYLQRHQQHVRTLRLKGPDPRPGPGNLSQRMPLCYLPPCAQLEQVVLEQWEVQLGPSAQGLAALMAGQTAPSSTTGKPQQQLWWWDTDADPASSDQFEWTSDGFDNSSDDGRSSSSSSSSSSSADGSPHNSKFGLLQALPALKQLYLINCNVPDSSKDLGAAAAAAAAQPGLLQGLTNLERLDVQWRAGSAPPKAILSGG